MSATTSDHSETRANTPAVSTRAVVITRGGALDALRFVAALFVVVFHYRTTAPIPLQDLHLVWSRGHLATGFFILISGFALARTYGAPLLSRRLSPVRFWAKRFWRIYPAHIITLLMFMVLVAAATAIGSPPAHPENFPISGLPAQVFMLQAFGFGSEQWNIPTWTLSVLLVLYAIFPWLWRLVAKITSATLVLALALALLAASQALSLSLLDQSVFSLSGHWVIARGLPLFLCGLLLARALEQMPPSAHLNRLIALAGVIMLLTDVLWLHSDLAAFASIGILTLGLGGLAHGRAIPAAAWGAKISFPLFITHSLTGAVLFAGLYPIAERLMPALFSGPTAWAMWGAAIVAALIAATLFDRLIDAPLQRFIRRRWFSA